MTYEKIFADLKKTMLKADTSKLEGNFAFQCVIEGDGEGTFYFALKDGIFSVEPYDYVGATATFKAAADTYKSIFAGKITVEEAIATGALTLDKADSYADILGFFAKKAAKKAASKTTTAKTPAKKAAPAKKEAAPKKTAAKKAEAPKAEVKKTEAPKKAEVKKVEAPKAEVKKVEAPKAEVKKTEAPKAEVKKEAAPKAAAKKAPAKKTTKK